MSAQLIVTWMELSSPRSLHGGMGVWKPPGLVGLLFFSSKCRGLAGHIPHPGPPSPFPAAMPVYEIATWQVR